MRRMTVLLRRKEGRPLNPRNSRFPRDTEKQKRSLATTSCGPPLPFSRIFKRAEVGPTPFLHKMSPIIIAFLSLSLSVLPPSSADKFTAYEALQTFNLPIGLLPKGALGYDLDEKTGEFTAYLNQTCSFSLEGSYDLKYQSKITGYISRNKLRNLNGISVKVLFLWLNIVEVTRVDDEIEFSVGIASASFPIDNFDQCPQCGCGLDCDTVHVRKMKSNAFVSSL